MSKEHPLFKEKNLKSYFVGCAANLIDPNHTFDEDKVRKAVEAGHEMYENLKRLGLLNIHDNE